MALRPQTIQPVICAICNKRMLDHFKPDGSWDGCYVLENPRVIMLPQPQVSVPQWPVMPLQLPQDSLKEQAQTYLAAPPPDADRVRSSRVRYKPVKRAPKSAEERLRGQVRQVYVLVNTKGDDGITAKEISDTLGIKLASVEHATWRLRHDKLVETVPV